MAIKVRLTLLCLLQAVSSRSVPTRTWVRNVNVEAAPAVPTPTLTSDFQKNNVTAKWAEGHPKQWSDNDQKYQYPPGKSRNGVGGVALTADEKYLVVTEGRDIHVLGFGTNTTISIPTFSPIADTYDISEVRVASAPNGQYDVLVSTRGTITNPPPGKYDDRVYGLKLSSNATQIGGGTKYEGVFSTFDVSPLSPNGRRFLTLTGSRLTDPTVIINDLDKPINTTLVGHTDSVMSAVYSSNSKYIATASWDGYGKLWDATTGELLNSFGPTDHQNWAASFSPDSKQVLISEGDGSFQIWSVGNSTTEPITVKADNNWIRVVEWSPDGEYLAIGGYGLIIVYQMKGTSTPQIVQKWETVGKSFELGDFAWLDGSKKLAFRIQGALEIYDFEKNLKYHWGPGDLDHFFGVGRGVLWHVKSKNWIGGFDGDSKIRFYDMPK